MMLIEDLPANPGDVSKGEVGGQEAADGLFIGGVEGGPSRATGAGHLEAEIERRKGRAIGRFKVYRTQLGPGEFPGWPGKPIGISERVLDR